MKPRATPGNAGIRFIDLDVRDPAAITSCIDALPDAPRSARQCRGHHPSPMRSMIRNVFAQVIDINLNGSMRLCSAALERLTAGGAAASSIWPSDAELLRRAARSRRYSASKGGIAQLTRSLAAPGRRRAWRVNALRTRLDCHGP